MTTTHTEHRAAISPPCGAAQAGGASFPAPCPQSPVFGHARQIADALARIEAEDNAKYLADLRRAAEFELEC